MRHYIPPRANETDAEFWARMAKMAEGAGEDQALHTKCRRIAPCAVPASRQRVGQSAAITEHHR